VDKGIHPFGVIHRNRSTIEQQKIPHWNNTLLQLWFWLYRSPRLHNLHSFASFWSETILNGQKPCHYFSSPNIVNETRYHPTCLAFRQFSLPITIFTEESVELELSTGYWTKLMVPTDADLSRKLSFKRAIVVQEWWLLSNENSTNFRILPKSVQKNCRSSRDFRNLRPFGHG